MGRKKIYGDQTQQRRLSVFFLIGRRWCRARCRKLPTGLDTAGGDEKKKMPALCMGCGLYSDELDLDIRMWRLEVNGVEEVCSCLNWNPIWKQQRRNMFKIDSKGMNGWLGLCQNLKGQTGNSHRQLIRAAGKRGRELWMSEDKDRKGLTDLNIEVYF